MDAVAGMEPRQCRSRPALPAHRSAPMDVPWRRRRVRVIQALLVTPLLFAALAAAACESPRATATGPSLFRMARHPDRLGFFVLGFFADTERVSFHWPLPGYVALLPLLPATAGLAEMVAANDDRRWPRSAWSACSVITPSVSTPDGARAARRRKVVSEEFRRLGRAGRRRAQHAAGMPADTRHRRGQLQGWRRARILRSAIRRSPCCRIRSTANMAARRNCTCGAFGSTQEGPRPHPVLLVVGASEVEYKNLLSQYHALCNRLGPLPPPRVVNVDHGSQRFLMFALDGKPRAGVCTTPAMAWLDQPVNERLSPHRSRCRDGRSRMASGCKASTSCSTARRSRVRQYGLENRGVAWFLEGSTTRNSRASDSGRPSTWDRCRAGRHWLGLRLTGRDGSIEDWSEQPITVR